MRIGTLITESGKPFFSLEFFPPGNEDDWPDFFRTAEKLGELNPLYVSVTYGAGGAKQDNTLGITRRLARMGFHTMAHLTCVGAESEAIELFLRQLRKNGVNNVLALRGDPPKNRSAGWNDGMFRHAVDLVRFIKRTEPEMGIGVAAYPNPHPESMSFFRDRLYTAHKLASGADFAITQLFFDAREYEALCIDLRHRGIHVPIEPGILPIQSLDSLRRVLSLCGASIPGNLYLSLEEANRRGGAEAVREAGFAFSVKQIRRLLEIGAPGIHLYTLNKSELCARIIKECGLA